jgi:Ca2+-binding RTX toxin-like protein
MARKSVRSWDQDDYMFGAEDFVALPYLDSIGSDHALDGRRAKAPKSPTADQQVSFLNGLTPDGRLTDNSYWGFNDQTVYKWGESKVGTGATITYFFDPSSRFSAVEKATFLKAFGMWSAIADVSFVEVGNSRSAGVFLTRGDDGGAYNSTPSADGRGTTPGKVTGQALISVDTSVPGFDLSGSLDTYGGYGMSTIIHEVGHLLGLGHGGYYNGSATPRTQQFSAFDDRMFTIMSYINWTDTDAKYAAQNPIPNTYWGYDEGGNYRTAPHTVMGLDIIAIQQLYGVSESSPFTGGQTYGFHSNIYGVLRDFYDFSVNISPVVTIYNQGTNNTIDLSEWSYDALLDLRPGNFSSVGGLSNNLFVQWGTDVTRGIGGSGDDYIIANDRAGVLMGGSGSDELWGGKGADWLQGDGGDDLLWGGAGKDMLVGGSGADLFWFNAPVDSAKKAAQSDVILDFNRLDGDRIVLQNIDAVKGGQDNAFTFLGTRNFTRTAGDLIYKVVNGDAQVMGDVNGDGKADFVIIVDNVTSLGVNDFVL